MNWKKQTIIRPFISAESYHRDIEFHCLLILIHLHINLDLFIF